MYDWIKTRYDLDLLLNYLDRDDVRRLGLSQNVVKFTRTVGDQLETCKDYVKTLLKYFLLY